MPGISLFSNINSIADILPALKNYVKEQNHLDTHFDEILFTNRSVFVGINKYSSYPIHLFSNKTTQFIVEGKIYNKKICDVEDELKELFNKIKLNCFKSDLEEWIKNTDGDYIVYIVDGENIYIFNDIFGRIPLYVYSDSNCFIASRYLQFVKKNIPDLDFDSTAIAEFMLLGYMLDGRTILQDVNLLKPGSLIKVIYNQTEIYTIHKFNFENRNNTEKKLTENIENLSTFFKEASEVRTNKNNKNIVALSAGLDSRAVVTALFKTKANFICTTMHHLNGYGIEEESLAKQISEILNIKWQLIEVHPPKGESLIELLKLKEGMNSIYTASIIPFYKNIIKKFGNDIHYFTGDNGDKIIYTIDQPIPEFRDLDDLVNFIVDNHSIISISQLNSISPINENKLLNEIKKVLSTYPEKNLQQKYIHFRAIEKPFNYAFQGEDRHRNYFWNVSPFWSYKFFDYLMNCSDKSKIKHRLFRKFLQSYSFETTKVIYSNFNASITSVKGRIIFFLIYHIFSKIPVRVKKMVKIFYFSGNKKINSNSVNNKLLATLLNENSISNKYFSLDKIKQIQDFRKTSIYLILTILSSLEFLSTFKTSIENFYNDEFD